ncbi:response regulator [bacterium]|nr:response regulator [candidate division CSSED10-310 bacterium]
MMNEDHRQEKPRFDLDDLIRSYRESDGVDSGERNTDILSQLDDDVSAFIMQHYDQVLILERNDVVGEAVFRLLRAEGYNVEWAKDRDTALEKIREEEISTVLVSEGFGADALFIRDQIEKLGLHLNVRSIKDFGTSILGHEETEVMKKIRHAFHHMTDFLMRFLESFHPPMAGHAREVAKLAREVAIRMELLPDIVDGITITAYFHELPELLERYKPFWKKSEDIFGDLDLALMEWSVKDLTQAMQYPFPIEETLNHMQERYDGKGYPDGLEGDAIPIGSRIIAPIDIFMTMTSSSASGPSMSRGEALDQLIMDSGSAFDPIVVEILVGILKKELTEGETTEYRESLLIVDTLGDDDLQKIQLREEGYVVSSAATLNEAIDRLVKEEPFMIISDIDLSAGDGYELLQYVRNKSNRPDMPFVFMSARNDPSFIAKAYRAGADDYIPRPCVKDMLLARIARIIARAKGQRSAMAERKGVTGSLKDMGIMEVIQILGAGMRSAMITIVQGASEARVALSEGRIVFAKTEENEGDEAFYSLLGWEEGEFNIHMNVQPPKENITLKNDMLLLEGFRRMDETRR